MPLACSCYSPCSAVPNVTCCMCSSTALVYCTNCSEVSVGLRPGRYCAACDDTYHRFAHCHMRTTWAVKGRYGVERHLQPCEGLASDGVVVARMWLSGSPRAHTSTYLRFRNVIAGTSVLRTATPAQCPDCMEFDSMARLPQVFTGQVFTECTVEDGNISNQQLPNFYCTACMRTVFSASRCERYGEVDVPGGLLEPRLANERDAILWVLVPATPARTQTVFRMSAIQLRNALKYRYVVLGDARGFATHEELQCSRVQLEGVCRRRK